MKADTKIVRALVASLFGIVFGAVSAFADSATVTNAWFAEPTSPLSSSWQAKLNSEPADLSTCATLVEGKIAVDVDRDAGYSLTYAPTSVVSQAQIVTAKLNFQSAYDFDALPTDVDDAKAGVALVRDESVFKFAYYNGSAWVKSDAASLSVADGEIDVRISLTGTELKYEYKSADGYITLGTVQTANKVASAEFLGSGVIAKFDGLVEQEAVVPAATVDGKTFATLEEALEYAIANKKTLTANVDCSTESGYDLKAGTTVAFTEDGATITTAADADTAKAPVTAGQTLSIAKGVLLAGGPVKGDGTKIVVGDGATLKLTDNLTLGETKLMLAALFGAGENATELILNTGANLDLNGFKILLENDGKVTSATKLDIGTTFGDTPGYHVEESGSGPYTYTLIEDQPEPPPPADEDWFDGKIGADWPGAEGMKGSWCDNAASLATFVAEKSALEIDTGNDLLRFTPENAGDLTTGIATITTTVSFTAMDLASLPDVNDPSTLIVKGGLALVRDGENMAFYAVVKKTGEEANEWVKIDAFDALAVEETAVDVKIVMKQSNGKTLITYALGAVTSAEYEIVMPNAATTINAVSYRGCGEVKNLAGIYKQGEVLLDGVPYDTFQGAYEAATNGATIKLLKDVSWAPAPFAYGLKNVTIDANGKTLTVDSSAANTFKSIGYKYTYANGQIKVEMPFGGKGTEAEPWEVGSYDDLVYFRNGVNAGSYGVSGEFFKQTASIDFAAVNAAEPWVGIGNEASRFVGTYDGDGKTISNLVLTNSVDGEAAFFCTVSNATIKSMTFNGVSLDAGALANKADAAAVVCYSYGDLTMTDITVNGDTPFEAAGNIAGICVNARYGATFTHCVNNLPLIGHYTKLGGICTYATGGTAIFNSCTNTAAITASGTCKNGANNAGCDGLGGIVGYAQGSAVLTFQNCANTGALTAVDADTTKAAAAIGSILGYAQSCSFSNSYGNTAQDSVPAVARGVVNAAGLNFAKVAGGVATMISSGELLPGTLDAPKSYKVMSKIATAGVTLVADQAITLDKTFNTAFTPTFTDLPGYHVEETAVSASVTTYARVQDTVTLRFAEGALEGKHIDASKTVVMQGAEVIAANEDGSYTLASNSTYTVTYTAAAGYVFPNGLTTYTTAAAQAIDAVITIEAGAIDPAHPVFTITFTPNATATYTVTTNGYTFTPAGDEIVLDENAAFTVTAAPVEGFSFTQTPTGWEKSDDNLVLSAAATATKTIVIPTAEEPTTAGWFDGKINASWPNAEGMKGEWCANAASLATFGDGKLAVSADSESLAFTPDDAGKLKTDILTIQSTMKFTAMDPADLPYGAELDEDKIGLTLVDTGAGVALYAIKADGATNVWFDLGMSGITDETEFDVTSVIETSNGKGQVTYTINGTAFGQYPILADADSTVTEISYKGSGEVKTLVGTTEAAGAAMIGDDIYDSFDAAYAAATDGQTIKLLKSQTWNGAFAGYKNVTIDANGKVLTIGDAVNAYAAKGLVCSYENGTLTVKIPFDGTGAEATPWQIDSYENLVLFKNGVNAGTYGTNGEFFVQTANIDLAGKPAWDGIGIYTKAGQNKGDFGFAATYDGAGYKISNLTFPNKKYAALFAQVGQTNKVGVVKNLTVENAAFVDMSASGEWGGAMIVGHLENGTISACCSAGTLGSEQYPLTHNASGILGRLGAGTVENCTNTAALFAANRVGADNGTKIGGIVNICQIDPKGKTGASTIRGCVNTGALTFVAGTANDGTGGILGYASNGGGVVIENCVNTGAIVSTLANDKKVGQVIGYISNNAVTATGNTVNDDQLALGGTATVDGLDFATVAGGVATLVSTNDFVAGNTYKVMSAKAGLDTELKLAKDETIAFDNALNTAFDAEGMVVAANAETCKIEKTVVGTVTTFSCVEIKWATVIVAADEGVTVALTNNDVAVASGFKADIDSNEVVTVAYTLKDGYTLDESTPAASIPASVTLNEEKDYVIAITTRTSAVTITVPDVAHATYIVQCISTDGVTTNDVTTTKKIPYGWTARIVYTATDIGYQLSSPSTFLIPNVTSAGDVVFVAPTPSPIAYTLKYVANGGTGADVTTNLTYDVAHTVIANPFTKQGYNFTCWTNEAAEASYQPGAEVINLATEQGATVTFKAVWTENWRTITMPESPIGYTYVISNETTGATLTEKPYKVLDGDVVTIYYTAAAGYVIDKTFVSLGEITADTEVKGDKLPTATAVYALTVTPNANATAVIKIGGVEVELVDNTTNILDGTAVEITATPDAANGWEYQSAEGWTLEDGIAKTNFAIAAHATITVPQPTLMEALFTVPVGEHVTAVVTNVAGTVLTTNAVGQYSATWGDSITATYTADVGYTPTKTEQTATVTNGYAFIKVNTTADAFAIAYKNADGSDFAAWADGYEPPTEFTVAEKVTLPTAANINQENFLFNAWTNAAGAAVADTAGLVENLTVYADITKLWTIKLPEVANAEVKAYTNDTVEVTGKVVDGAEVKFVVTPAPGYVLEGTTEFKVTARGNDTTVESGLPTAKKVCLVTVVPNAMASYVVTNGNDEAVAFDDNKHEFIEGESFTLTATANAETGWIFYPTNGWEYANESLFTNVTVGVADITITIPQPFERGVVFEVPVGPGVNVTVTNVSKGVEITPFADGTYGAPAGSIVKAYYSVGPGWELEQYTQQRNIQTGVTFNRYEARAIGYTITYKNADGTAFTAFIDGYVAPTGFCVTNNVTLPTAEYINQENFIFSAWTNASGEVTSTEGILENLTVAARATALWSVKVPTAAGYVCTATTNGYAVVDGEKVVDGEIVTFTFAVNPGYVFDGPAEISVPASANGVSPSEDQMPKAYKIVTYTFTGDAEKGFFTVTTNNETAITLDEEGKATLIEATTLTIVATPSNGYEYATAPAGWTKNGESISTNGLVLATDESIEVPAAKLRQVDFEVPVDDHVIVVVTNLAGGAALSTNNLGKYTAPYFSEIKATYAAATGYTLVNGDAQARTITDDMAAFEPVTTQPITYTLRYTANGGEGDDVTTNLVYDVEHTVIENPFTMAGYGFVCWTNEASGVVYAPKAKIKNLTTTQGDEIVFKAVWGENWRTITMPAETTGYTYVISNATTGATLTEKPYRVLDGSKVVIYYTATEGYSLDKATYTIDSVTGDVEVKGENLPMPSIVDFPFEVPVGDNVAVVVTNVTKHTGLTPEGDTYTVKYFDYVTAYYTAATGYTLAGDATQTIRATNGAEFVEMDATPNEYTLTYKPGEGEGADIVSNLVYGVEYAAAENTFTKTGYSFVYWTNDVYGVIYEGDAISNLTAEVDGNVDFTAVYTANVYQITYKLGESEFTDFIDGYTAPTEFTVAKKVTLPTAAKINQENFLFNAWTNESGKVTSTEGFAENLTVYADITKLWTIKLPTVENATVKAYTNDTVEVTGKVVDGATVKFVVTANEGYVLVGQTEFTTTATGDDTTVDVGGLVARKIVTYTFTGENVELAVATNSAPVTLDEEGKATLIEASTLTVTATPNEGYYYETAPDGWTLTTGVISTNGVVLATDETIAVPAPARTNFTFAVPVGEHVTAVVTNETAGGEALTPEGDTYTVKYFEFVKASYTAATGYTLVNGDDQTIQATNGAAFVEVTATANDYKVKYVDGAGAEAVSNATYDVEFAISENVFAKTGYHFTGWTNETDNVGYQPGEIVSNLTTSGEYLLTAVWAANEYEVRYNANGGEGAEFCATNTYDTAFTAAATNGFTKTGYTFANWTNDTYSIAAGVETNVNLSAGEGVTLYAAWTPNAYTLTYKPGEGEGEDIVSNLVYDVEYAAAENTFTKTGYSFVCWTNAAGAAILEGAPISNLTDEPNGNVDFTAVYTANVYQITFDSKGGSAVEPIVASCDEAVEAPAVPTYDGYTFAGWFTNNAEEAYVFTTMPAGGLELFAKWTTNAYTITYKLNDAPFYEWKSGYMAPTTFTTVDPATIPTVENVVQTNYAFYGWTTNGADFTSATTEGIFTNLTLTARVTKLWTITAAQIDNATCTIKTNGLEAVAGEDGVYRALQGAPVSVVYTAKDGYKFQDGTTEIVKEFEATENMEVKVEDVLPSIKYFTITLPNGGEYDNINTTVTTNGNPAVAGEDGVYEVFSNDTFKVAFEKAADDYELEGGINPNEFTVVSNVTIAIEDIPVAWKLFTITMPEIPTGLVYTVTNELKGTLAETNGYIAAGETYTVRTNTNTRFIFTRALGYKWADDAQDIEKYLDIQAISNNVTVAEVPAVSQVKMLKIAIVENMSVVVSNGTMEITLEQKDGYYTAPVDTTWTLAIYFTAVGEYQLVGGENPKTVPVSDDVTLEAEDLPKPLPIVAEYTVGGGALQKTWNATNVVALFAAETAQKLDVKFVKESADITTLPAEFAYEFEQNATIVVTPATAGGLPTVEITSGELTVKADVEAEKNIVINGNVNFEGTAIKSGNRDTFVTVNGDFTCGSFTNGTEGAEGVATLVVTGAIGCTGTITIIPGSTISAKASNYAACMETLAEYAISVAGPDADGYWTYSAAEVGTLIFEDENGNPIVVPGDSVEALEQYIIEQSLLDPDYEALLFCNEEVTLNNGEGGKYVFPAGTELLIEGADWFVDLAEDTTLVSDKMNIENDKTISVKGGTVEFTEDAEIKASEDEFYPTSVNLAFTEVCFRGDVTVGTGTGVGWAELCLGDVVDFDGGKIILLAKGSVASYCPLTIGTEIVSDVSGMTVFEEYDAFLDTYIYSLTPSGIQELLPFDETTVTADNLEAAQAIADTFVVKSEELEVNNYLYQNGKVAEYQSLFKFTATASGTPGVFTVKAAFAPEVLASISNEVNSAAAKIMNDFRYQRSGEINIATKPGIWYGVRAGDTIDELKAVDVKWMLGTGGEVSLKWNVKDGSKQAYYFVEAVTKRPTAP